MYIYKANGERVLFDPEKIRQSLGFSGADPVVIEEVIRKTIPLVHENMTTKALYKIVHKFLKKVNRSYAGKYHLKKGILELGPSGFPFEVFISQLFEVEGFAVQTGQFVEGHCVQHEVDVVADKGRQQFMMECKFHKDQGRVCGIKTALYVHARFMDVEKNWQLKSENENRFFKGWLVTNTRFSSESEQYGTCAGLGLLSWNYPLKNSLSERISRHGLHPITCITSFNKSEKQFLLNKGIVLCRQLCKQFEVLNEMELSNKRKKQIIEEAGLICKI